MPLTEPQQKFLNAIRSGDIHDSGCDITLPGDQNDTSRDDIVRFKNFLIEHGQPNPQPADLYLTIKRDDFLQILQYAEIRNCLILQCCFGLFKRPIIVEEEVDGSERRILQIGRLLILQKGNFQEIEVRNDDDFFTEDTVFQNANGDREIFLNLDLGQPILDSQARVYQANYRALFSPDITANLGYLLPVKALLTILTDPTHQLGTANMLTVHWGLTELGNFSLIIGTDDLLADPTIEFGRDFIAETGDPVPPPCPPTPGCN